MTALASITVAPEERLRLSLATAYLLFVAILPPQVGSAAYSTLMLAATAAYLLPDMSGRIRQYVFSEYVAFTALVLVYVALSVVQVLRVDGRLFEAQSIAPQSAGLLLICVIVPGLTKATRVLFAQKARVMPLLVLAAFSAIAAVTWRQSESVIAGGQLYGVLAPALFIQFAIFAATVTLVANPLVRTIILLLPIPFLGAASNVVVQIALIGVMLIPFHKWLVRLLTFALVLSMILAITGSNWLDPLVRADTNTMVRLQLWRSAAPDLFAHPFGIGFGTAYSDFRAFADPFIYHVYKGNEQSALTIANHSSLIDMPLRLGLFGLLLFVLMVRRCFNDALHSPQALLATGAIATVLVTGAMNPMVESARSALFVAFALGLARGVSIPEIAQFNSRTDYTPEPAQAFETPAQRRKNLAAQAAPISAD